MTGRKPQHVVWDSPGGLMDIAPRCFLCDHPEATHLINAKGKRTTCTVGPINDVVVQCPCKGYQADWTGGDG